jgi:hypothetical protein
MTKREAEKYAETWARDWNARDLERILDHFDDDVVFSSPKALVAVGHPTVRGNAALRAYWERALAGIGSLQFTVVRTIWDPDSRELAIIYDRVVDGKSDRAAEILAFGAAGKVVRGEVMYGVCP